MKWAKRKNEADPNIPPDQRAMHFREYDQVIVTGVPPRQTAEAINGGALVRTLFEWARFDNLNPRIPATPAQRKYEIWVGAYLNFRTPPIDYEVFFEWQPGGRSLVIFLYPNPFAASPVVADPPPTPAPPPPETSQ